MDLKEIQGVPFGYEFRREEFKVIARNLILFAHPAIAAEIRANNVNTTFGRKVNQFADIRFDRSQRQGSPQQTTRIDRLRYERDQIRALLASEAPLSKERDTNIVLGMFTTQVAFEELAQPLLDSSPSLYEPELLGAMRNSYLLTQEV